MNGINEMIAFAATLKAKVCTSLSSRYAISAVPLLRHWYHLDCVTGCSGPVAAAAIAAPVASMSLATSVASLDSSATFESLVRSSASRGSGWTHAVAERMLFQE